MDGEDIDIEDALSLKRTAPLISTAVQHSFGRGKGCVEKLMSQLVFPQATNATHNVLRRGGGGVGVTRCGKMRGVATGDKPKISGRARVLMRGHVEERKPGMCRTIRCETRWADLLTVRDKNTMADKNLPEWTDGSTVVLYPVAVGINAEQIQLTLKQFGVVTHCVVVPDKGELCAYVRMQQECECDRVITGVYNALGSHVHCSYALK